MKWAAQDTRDAAVYAVKIMDAVVGRNESLLIELCRECWSSIAFFSAVMAMLPKPVRDYLGTEIMTTQNGYKSSDFWMNA